MNTGHGLLAVVFAGFLCLPALAQRLGVVTHGDYRVSIIDMEKNQLVHQMIDRELSSGNVQITPDNSLAIFGLGFKERRDLVYIDLQAEPPTIIDRVDIRRYVGSPDGLVTTSDGRYVLVENHGVPPFNLILVDIVARKVVDVIPNIWPLLITVIPDGQFAIVYTGDGAEIRVFSITDGRLRDTGHRIPALHFGGFEQLAVTPNGRLLFGVGGPNFFRIFTIAEDGVVEYRNSLQLAQQALAGMVITPDMRKVYVSDPFRSEVRVLRIDEDERVEDTLIRIFIPSGTPAVSRIPGLAITSEGRFVYLCSSRGLAVSIIDVETDTVLPEVIEVGGPRPLGIALQQ